MQYKPKKPPEGINAKIESPLNDALFLTGLTIAVMVLLYFMLGFATDRIVNKFTLKQEAEFFQKDINHKTDTREEKIQDVVDQLWQHYPESNSLRISAKIKDIEMMNAFMELGGNLSVTEGLLKKMKYENQLAFVICHEIGHFYNRDVLQGMGRKLGLVVAMSMIGMSDTLDIFSAGANSLNLAFDRKQEENADAFAIDCMQKHYGHVQGFDEFFNLVEDKKSKIPQAGKKVLSFVQTHPMTSDRISNLEKLIQEKGYSPNGKLKRLPY